MTTLRSAVSFLTESPQLYSFQSQTKTRKTKFFRAAIRKNSCTAILYVNIAVLVILILAVHVCTNFSIFAIQVLKRDAREQPILLKYNSTFQYLMCPYQTPDDYNTVSSLSFSTIFRITVEASAATMR